MLNLTISHYIYLTRDQRYALHEGESQEVVGVSMPVWYNNKKTSEPAEEIFCKYYLKNPKNEIPIQILKDGYEIHLPTRAGVKPKELTNDEWRKLNKKELEAHYNNCKKEISSKNLTDFKDGGCQCLIYREHNKTKKHGMMMNIIHYVNIKTIEQITESQQ